MTDLILETFITVLNIISPNILIRRQRLFHWLNKRICFLRSWFTINISMTKIDNKNNFLQTIKNVGYADTK